MKQARRASAGRNELTLVFYPGDKHNPIYVRLKFSILISVGILFCALLIFTFYVAHNSEQLLSDSSGYAGALSQNQLLKTKLALAGDLQNDYKEQIHALKIQEAEIKELLIASEFNSGAKPPAPSALITTHRIVTGRGEFGRVLIDNKIVVEYFDDAKMPMAFQRALVTAAKLKSLPASARKFQTKKSGNSVYAYIDGQPIFVVLPEDTARLNEPLSADELAKYWLKNIKDSLALKKTKITLADRLPWLRKENRQKSEIYKTLYPSINYPPYAALLESSLTTGQYVQNAEHLLKLSRQEIAASRRSFEELKNYVQSYKDRFDHTPSIFPVNNAYVFSDYGWRQHPILNNYRFHSGIDLPAWEGVPIYATAAGVVQQSGWMDSYGYKVEIDHGYGFSTLYGHNSVNLVKPGQRVKKGQIIARVGSTGLSEGNHCHYEVRYYDRPVDPTRFLNLNIFTASNSF